MLENNYKLSVVIPSYDGYRGGNVALLLEDLKKQTYKYYDLYIVKGISPNGRARNVGIKKVKGEIILFIDDDVRLGTKKLIENILNVFSSDEKIAVVGTSRFLIKNANKFQKKSYKQLPRSYFPIVKTITESDMATHDCLAIRRSVYEEVGGEDENLVRGTDPDLRYKIRKRGYKIVIAPKTWIYHPLPSSWNNLIEKAFNNGVGSAFVFRKFPEKNYEAPDYNKKLQDKISFINRWKRRLKDLFLSLFKAKYIRFVYDFIYILGYIYGLIASEKKLQKKIY